MKELELIIGWQCNNNCLFCSNQHMKNLAKEKNLEDISLEKIKENLKVNSDNKELILVGGEPTIRPDIFEIISFAKKQGYREISMMSNGRMLSSIDFCKKLLGMGITEIGISIHGHTKEIHDSLTRSPGSFKQVVRALKNLNHLKKDFVTNTVITKKGMHSLPQLVAFLSGFRPKLITLTFPNPRGNAEEFFQEIIPKLSEAAPFVHKAIDAGKVIGQEVHACDIPLCFMKDYKESMQESFFDKERKIVTHVFPNILLTKNTGRDKSKHKSCEPCKHNSECEGVWTNYLNLMQDTKITPIK